MEKANRIIFRVLTIVLSILVAFGQISYAEETPLTLSAEYNSATNLVKVEGTSPGSWVTMYLLYPGKKAEDVKTHTDSDKAFAHIWQIPVADGAYVYNFDPNVTLDGDYTVHVKAGAQMAEESVYIGKGKIGNIYDLPTDTYGPLEGNTTRERFESAMADVPDEMPVYTPVEIDGALKIYVSPVSGNDSNDGSIQNPVKTVQKAVALSKTMDIRGGCVIYLRQGIYDCSQKIALSGITASASSPYIVSAYNNEKVVFTDGYSLDALDFRDADDSPILSKMPSDVRDSIMEIDLSSYGITDFATPDKIRLSIDDTSYSVARWPNNTTTKMREYTGDDAVNGVIDPGSENGMEFCIEDIRPYSWQNTGDIMLVGAFYAEWWFDSVTLKEFNPEKRSVVVNEVIVHGENVGAKYAEKNSFYWVNVLEELDSPGEFYIDKDTKKLYVYPIKDITKDSEIILSCSSQYTSGSVVSVSGGSCNIVINGISFKSCSKQKIVSLSSCSNVLVQNCLFKDSVGGFLIQQSTSFCGVINSTFQNVKGFFPIVSAKSPPSEYVRELKPQHNFVQNNYFYDCDKIIIRGIGYTISHNYFSNTSGDAIYCDSSNEVIIEYNEITSNGRNINDCGAIYVGGRQSASAGIYVRNNYIHDSVPDEYTGFTWGARGIYLDDLNSNAYVYNNVLENAKAIFMHGGSDNSIYNNIIINGGDKAIADSENHMKDTHVRLDSIVPNYLEEDGKASKYLDETDEANYIDVLSEDSPYRKRYPAMSEWSELLKKRMIEYRTQPETRGEGKSQYTQEYTNGTVANLDKYIVSPRYNYYDCNVVVGDSITNSIFNTPLSITDTGKISAEIGTNKYYYKSQNPFANGYTKAAYDTVREKIPGFKDIDVNKAGVIIASSDSEYTDNTYDSYISVEAPSLLYPKNGAKAVSGDVFAWNGSVAAAKYTLEISDTSDFATVLYSKDVYSTSYISSENLTEGSTYYWRVVARALSDKVDTAEAVSGVYSFVYGGVEDTAGISPVVYMIEDTKLTTWIYNTTGSDYNKEITVFAALYKGDTLADVNYTKVSSSTADSVSGPYEVTLDVSGGYDYAKIFVWDNDNLIPLSTAKILLP